MQVVGRVWERTYFPLRCSLFGSSWSSAAWGRGAAKHRHEFFWTWALSLYFGVLEALVEVELCVLGVVSTHLCLRFFLPCVFYFFLFSSSALSVSSTCECVPLPVCPLLCHLCLLPVCVHVCVSSPDPGVQGTVIHTPILTATRLV